MSFSLKSPFNVNPGLLHDLSDFLTPADLANLSCTSATQNKLIEENTTWNKRTQTSRPGTKLNASLTCRKNYYFLSTEPKRLKTLFFLGDRIDELGYEMASRKMVLFSKAGPLAYSHIPKIVYSSFGPIPALASLFALESISVMRLVSKQKQIMVMIAKLAPLVLLGGILEPHSYPIALSLLGTANYFYGGLGVPPVTALAAAYTGGSVVAYAAYLDTSIIPINHLSPILECASVLAAAIMEARRSGSKDWMPIAVLALYAAGIFTPRDIFLACISHIFMLVNHQGIRAVTFTQTMDTWRNPGQGLGLWLHTNRMDPLNAIKRPDIITIPRENSVKLEYPEITQRSTLYRRVFAVSMSLLQTGIFYGCCTLSPPTGIVGNVVVLASLAKTLLPLLPAVSYPSSGAVFIGKTCQNVVAVSQAIAAIPRVALAPIVGVATYLTEVAFSFPAPMGLAANIIPITSAINTKIHRSHSSFCKRVSRFAQKYLESVYRRFKPRINEVKPRSNAVG